MSLGKRWAGNIYGTNTGRVYFDFEGTDDRLSGKAHFNDDRNGIAVFQITGTFNGETVSVSGDPVSPTDDSVGPLKASGRLTPQGEIRGTWETAVGTAGTFHVYPHDFEDSSVGMRPPQIHTARHVLGAVEIDRDQFTALADDIQRDFKKGSVAVTVVAGTEQSVFLKDFANLKFNSNRAQSAQLRVQEPDVLGGNRFANLELGPFENRIEVQGADESWVLGYREKLRARIKRFERTYTINLVRFAGLGTPALLFWIALIFLPGLATTLERVILLAAIIVLNYTVVWLHVRFLPVTAIYLAPRSAPLIGPRVLSWLISIVASVIATLIAAFLQGWLQLPNQ